MRWPSSGVGCVLRRRQLASAINVLTDEQRRKHYAELEHGFRRRQHNLRCMIEAVGGWARAARLTGKAEAKLHQLADVDHPWHQSIGDKMARELEHYLALEPGALDNPKFDPAKLRRGLPRRAD